MESGSSLSVGRFHIGCVDELFRVREASQDRIFFSFPRGLIKRLNEWRFVGDVESERGCDQFLGGLAFLGKVLDFRFGLR